MHPGLHLAALGNFPAIVQLLISVPDIQVLLHLFCCHHHHFNQIAQFCTPVFTGVSECVTIFASEDKTMMTTFLRWTRQGPCLT